MFENDKRAEIIEEYSKNNQLHYFNKVIEIVYLLMTFWIELLVGLHNDFSQLID